ncbi:MAG: cell division protein FtsW [Candidatus Levybacteria bacterium]|nr:cell division protein FtsW [Candidatus Levybacteria bacterium]
MRRFDLMLLAIVVVLTLFGLLILFDASSFIAFRDFGDRFYYLREQSVWLVLGFLCLVFFSFFDYHRLYYLAVPILIVAIIMLLLVFVPGVGVYVMGARRWINVGFSVLQPGEFVKLGLAIYLAAWFSTKEKGRFLAFSLLVGFVLLLVMLEPDMGTASVILAEALVVYFISGGRMIHFLFIMPVLAAVGYLLIVLAPYRAARLATFLNFNQSLDATSYHVRQILIALGMGGISGVGLGNSLQKYAYLPENATDSIFAIFAEEFGFIGGVLLIALYMMLIWRGFVIASNAKDQFGKLLAGGITTYIGFQTIINLGAQTALIPLTGIPLPFISYGGSSLVVSLCAIGILLNISRQGTQHV